MQVKCPSFDLYKIYITHTDEKYKYVFHCYIVIFIRIIFCVYVIGEVNLLIL